MVDDLTKKLERLGHNYFTATRGGDYESTDVGILNDFVKYVADDKDLPKYKVGIMLIAINSPYWQYMKPVVEGINKFFLPGHDVEVMCWSDVPEAGSDKEKKLVDSTKPEAELEALSKSGTQFPPYTVSREYLQQQLASVRSVTGVTHFEVDSVGWPYPTLMRYHLMLQQEEYLQKFDYIFFLDLDMRVINYVGDEILGDGLTMAQHPMYALRQEFWPPYEPNPASAAWFKQPGRVLEVNGQKLFQPLYAAGGFQGGPTPAFIKAMKAMRKGIDDDFAINYIARWNDESHWNRYLLDNTPAVVLSPSYVYPDSMVKEYYVKLWGRDYPPKIITVTKPFSVNKEGGDNARKMIETL